MKKLHFWLSLPFGIFLFIICITGALLTFRAELRESFNKERYYVTQAGSSPLSDSTLVALLTPQLEGDSVANIKRSENEPLRTAEIALKSSPRTKFVYANPYTGEITGRYNSREGFWSAVMGLHRWLLLPNRDLGRWIVGISSIFMVLLVVSGVARWFKSKRLKLRRKTTTARRLFDLHNVLGIYAAIFLMALAITGLGWTFSMREWLPEGMKYVREIHFGTWGGEITRWLTMIAALIGASLPVTGYWMYFRRRVKCQNKKVSYNK